MDGSWNLYEVWCYDEYLSTYPTRESALKYIRRLVEERIYERQDLWVREVSG